MKKFLAFFLLTAMLFSAVACAVPDNLPGESRVPQGNGSDTNNTHADPGLPSFWYNNQSYKIMASDNVVQNEPARDVVYFEDKQSDAINESVHDRNVYVEETYGVKIEAVWPKDDMHVEVERAINAGLPNCSVMEATLSEYTSLADRGYLTDLNSMSQYLDMSQSWWDQNSRSAMSLGGALYVATGDIMITDKMATWAISFNRDMIANNNLENPYDLIDSYKWTYEKMYEMAASVSDAEFHEVGDYFGTTWGICSDLSISYYLWFGCGNSIFQKDENDMPFISTLTENAYDAMMDIATMQFDKNVTILSQDIKGVADRYFDGTIKIFQTGHALFFIGSTTMIEWLREYDMDFGVLPMPIASEDQRAYYSGVSNTQSCALAIPAYTDYTQEDYDFIGIILQALACESTATLQEAYYDKTLTYRGLRRPEDQRMLDLVFDGRVYDLSLVFSWADALLQEISSANSESKIKRLKSYYDSYQNSINKKISDYLTKHGLA